MTPDEREELRRLRAMRDRMRERIGQCEVSRTMFIRQRAHDMVAMMETEASVLRRFLRDLDASDERTGR